MMIRDRPLSVLVAAAAATYPALALGWCVAMLMGTQPEARALSLTGHPAPFLALALVAVAAVAIGRSLWTVTDGLRQTRRFHRWVTEHQIPLTEPVAEAAADAGLRGRVRLVATVEQVAVTAGLVRPYVVVSTGLLNGLPLAELRAVLAHEQAHVRRWHPLRVLLARVLVAHLWFLPLARDLRTRARSDYELDADRYAADRYGRPAVAAALLRVVSTPVGTGAVAGFHAEVASFRGDKGALVTRFADTGLLESRVSQLESGSPPRPAPLAAGRAGLSVVGAAAFVAAVAGAWAFMLLTCPCHLTG